MSVDVATGGARRRRDESVHEPAPEIHEALLQTVAAGPAHLPEPQRWTAWLSEAQTQRVVPALRELMDHPSARPTDDDRHDIELVHLNTMALQVRLEHIVEEALDELSAHSIEALVFKGLATAHLDYPDPARRQFGDVDILVRPREFERATNLLESVGWRWEYALPPGHAEFTHALALRHPERGEIDVHQHLRRRSLGLLVPTTALFDRAIEFDLNGTTRFAPTREDRLIGACLHAISAFGEYDKLSTTADILVLVGQILDPDPSLAAATRWRVAGLVDTAIRGAHQRASLPLPPNWAEALQHVAIDRRVDRAYGGDRRRPLWEELAYLELLDWGERRRYLLGHLRTNSQYERRFGRSTSLQQARYLLRKATNRHSESE